MPNTVLPLPDDPSSIVMDPLRTPPRSIVSSSGMPKPIFAPVAMGASASGARTEPRLEPRPHFETAIGDADRVQPAHRATATQFQDANMAQRPQLGQFVGEMQHPVDHGVFGEEPALTLGIGQQHDDASRQIRKHLELVEELLEISLRRGASPVRTPGRR